MPRRQRHRGQHPADASLFAPARIPRLREAVVDLSYLLTRGYAEKAALKVVGDHYQLTLRQRRAVLGASCSDQALDSRLGRRLRREDLAGQTLIVDGYNALITVESALSGAYLFVGRDTCIRDLASVHGSYRGVEETRPAIALLARAMSALRARAVWWFDAPVSNSGRLAALFNEHAEQSGAHWEAQTQRHVDRLLAEATDPVATADGWVLDRAGAWFNLVGELVDRLGTPPNLVDLAT